MEETTSNIFDRSNSQDAPAAGTAREMQPFQACGSDVNTCARRNVVGYNLHAYKFAWCVASICGLLLAASVHAQPDAVEPTNKAAVTVEEPDSTKESKPESSEWWDSDFDWEGKQIHGVRREAVVAVRKNAELKSDDWADTVVAVGGSATALGRVREVVVAIAGDVTVENQANGAVAVLGDVTVGPAGRIRDEIVAIGGNVTIRKGARVHRDVTAVGGKVYIEDGATVDGRVHEIDLGAIGFPRLNWLRGWFTHCFLLMRPLAPQVGWVWVIAIGLLAFYFFIAALFPKPVLACVNELTRRPATTFFMGFLTKLLFLP